MGFMLKKSGLVFTPTSQRTCFTCGSPHHLQFQCKEKQQKEQVAQRTSQFSSIYNRYHAKPSYPKGYTPAPWEQAENKRKEDDAYRDFLLKNPNVNDSWDWDSVPLPKDKGKTRENVSYAQATKSQGTKMPTKPVEKTHSVSNTHRPWNANNVQQHQI